MDYKRVGDDPLVEIAQWLDAHRIGDWSLNGRGDLVFPAEARTGDYIVIGARGDARCYTPDEFRRLYADSTVPDADYRALASEPQCPVVSPGDAEEC